MRTSQVQSQQQLWLFQVFFSVLYVFLVLKRKARNRRIEKERKRERESAKYK
jgi:hypothetical protein